MCYVTKEYGLPLTHVGVLNSWNLTKLHLMKSTFHVFWRTLIASSSSQVWSNKPSDYPHLLRLYVMVLWPAVVLQVTLRNPYISGILTKDLWGERSNFFNPASRTESHLRFWFLKGFVFVWANEASVAQSDQDLSLEAALHPHSKANEGSC